MRFNANASKANNRPLLFNEIWFLPTSQEERSLFLVFANLLQAF